MPETMKNENEKTPQQTAGPGVSVAVLCVTPRSYYKKIPGCDCYDEKRDAWSFRGGSPVVAHPPCRSWSRLRGFVKANCERERELAKWCVEQVIKHGGVLEHPAGSRLFPACRLPEPGVNRLDAHGGFTIKVWQGNFGHLVPKNTWLYICGCGPGDLPAMPFQLLGGSGRDFNSLSANQRKVTPPLFAEWLVDIARRCRKGAAK